MDSPLLLSLFSPLISLLSSSSPSPPFLLPLLLLPSLLCLPPPPPLSGSCSESLRQSRPTSVSPFLLQEEFPRSLRSALA